MTSPTYVFKKVTLLNDNHLDGAKLKEERIARFSKAYVRDDGDCLRWW